MDKIQPVNSISAFDIYKVLSSEKLTDNQKAEFLYKNSAAIKSVAESEITREEFKEIMANRPLIKFRPLKNSFTKQGDDIILAQALDINKKILISTLILLLKVILKFTTDRIRIILKSLRLMCIDTEQKIRLLRFWNMNCQM